MGLRTGTGFEAGWRGTSLHHKTKSSIRYKRHQVNPEVVRRKKPGLPREVHGVSHISTEGLSVSQGTLNASWESAEGILELGCVAAPNLKARTVPDRKEG